MGVFPVSTILEGQTQAQTQGDDEKSEDLSTILSPGVEIIKRKSVGVKDVKGLKLGDLDNDNTLDLSEIGSGNNGSGDASSFDISGIVRAADELYTQKTVFPIRTSTAASAQKHVKKIVFPITTTGDGVSRPIPDAQRTARLKEGRVFLLEQRAKKKKEVLSQAQHDTDLKLKRTQALLALSQTARAVRGNASEKHVPKVCEHGYVYRTIALHYLCYIYIPHRVVHEKTLIFFYRTIYTTITPHVSIMLTVFLTSLKP